MKKIMCIILVVVVASGTLSTTVLAAEAKAPQPQAYVKQYDGYSRVWFDIPEGAVIRYTYNGKDPTSSSKKYTGAKLKVQKTVTFKLRVTKKGCKTAIYSYKISVKYKSFENAVNAHTLKPIITGTSVDAYVKKAIKACVTDKMSTYEKIRACYTWLVQT